MGSRRNSRSLFVLSCFLSIGLAVLFGRDVYAQITSVFSATSTAVSSLTAAVATSTAPASEKFFLNDRVYTDDQLKVRLTPIWESPTLITQASGTPATIIGGPVFGDEFIWWKVDYDDSESDGWSIEDHLVKVEIPVVKDGGYSPTGEVKLTNFLARRSHPRIFGDKVVWAENRNGNSDIYLYNLTTRTEQRLTNGESDASKPSIYANRVVYVDRRSDQSNPGRDAINIYLKDLSSGIARPLTSDSKFQSEPTIYGDLVAYIETGYKGSRTIFLYNLLNNTKETIVSGKDIGNLQFAGNYIVWTDMSGGFGKIYVYDLKTKTKSSLAGRFGDQVSPAVSEAGKVVFGAKRRTGSENDWRVYVHDVVNGAEDVIGQETGRQPSDLSISGNLISWSRGGEIYLYDLGAAKETKLTNLLNEQKESYISNTALVWIDGRNANDDIYFWNIKK